MLRRLRLPDFEQLIQRGLRSRTDIAIFLLNSGAFLIAGRLIWKREIFIYEGTSENEALAVLARMGLSYAVIYLLARVCLAQRWPVLGWWQSAIHLLNALVYTQADNPYFLSPMLAAVIFAATDLKKPFVVISILSVFLGFIYMGFRHYETVANLIGIFSYASMLTLFGSVSFYLMARLLWQQSQQNEKLQAALIEREEFRALEVRNLALEERAHLSRELHDTLGHNLTVVRLQTQIAYKLAQRSAAHDGRTGDDKLLASLSDAVEHGREALQRLQEVVSALKHSDLEGSLIDTMRQTLEQWPGQVSLEVTGTEPELAPVYRLTLTRAFQESLTNAYKYAYGETLKLHLVFEGAGKTEADLPRAIFSASNALRADHTSQQELTGEFSRGGLGLDGLRLRFEKLGGNVQVDQNAEAFRVVYTLPLSVEVGAGKGSEAKKDLMTEADTSDPLPFTENPATLSVSPTSPSQRRGTP